MNRMLSYLCLKTALGLEAEQLELGRPFQPTTVGVPGMHIQYVRQTRFPVWKTPSPLAHIQPTLDFSKVQYSSRVA